MSELFRVGTPVWRKGCGFGSVIEITISPNSGYQVHVKFDDGRDYYYTLDGRLYYNDAPSLTPVDFAPGDTVSWCGIEGVLEQQDNSMYPLKLRSGLFTPTFTADGKSVPEMTEPSLFMVKRHDEPRPEPKFKVGDEVVICGLKNALNGERGVITQSLSDNPPFIYKITGPTTSTVLREVFLSPAPARPAPKFKVGDWSISKNECIKHQIASVTYVPERNAWIYERVIGGSLWYESELEHCDPPTPARSPRVIRQEIDGEMVTFEERIES